MRVERPPKDEADVVQDVENRDQPERRVKARRQVGDRKARRECPDRLGVARKPRIGRHAVTFERDPVGPYIAQIGRDDSDPPGPRLFGRDDVIGPSVAVQDEVGDTVLLQHFADKAAPIIEPAAEIGRRQMPEQPVAAMQIDPVDAMPARHQRAAEPVEKVGDRPLQEKERARRGRRFCGLVFDNNVLPPHRAAQAGSKAETAARGRQRWRPIPNRSRRSTDFQ